MARRDVIEITCDRCGRTETQTRSQVVPNAEAHEFSAYMYDAAGETEVERHLHIQFDDLCRKCRTAVRNYFDQIRKAKDEDKPAKLPLGSGAHQI